MKRILVCLFLVFIAFPGLAQQPDEGWLTALKKRFQEYAHQQSEKIYLHTDREVYASADTVWFKAYLVDKQTNVLHPVPEVLYVDLISEKNEILVSQRLQTESGYKAGSLILPDTLKTGNYLLQVYTNWQRNSGVNSFFRKALFVNKIPQKQTVLNSGEKVPQNILFFPEGGSLREGFESKVAVKMTGTNGLPISGEGKIMDEAGKVVAVFNTKNTGVGSFLFRPQAGKSYKAQVSGGTEQRTFPLPAAQKGYALSLKNSPDSVTVLLAAAENNTTPTFLVIQSNGNLLVADSVKFNANGLRKRSFSTKEWPEGIVQALLYSSKEVPENERFFFHLKSQKINVKFETAKTTYTRREPVQLSVLLNDEAGKPVEAELSVAVTNNLPAYAPPLTNAILFGSEIPETDQAILSKPEALDALLLTQKLTGFSLNSEAAETNQPSTFARETELNRPGKVTENGAAVAKAVIYLLETNNGETHLVTTDAEGRFKVPSTGKRFFYQVWQNGVLRQKARLELVKAETVALSETWKVNHATDSLRTKQFKLRRQIERVYAQDAERSKFKLVNKELWPWYPADKYYPLAEYNQFPTMEEILKEMVPEVRIIKRNKQVQANVYDKDRRIFYPYQPLYIIDGQPTWNHDLFLRLDATQLEQVNIYNSDKSLKPFGFMGNQGVIVVFTKSHNYQNPDLATENILNIPGQQAVVQYKPTARPANVPDFRPTLFWNPKVQTDAKGEAKISFSTTDEMGNLKVQVQGITKDGKLISEEFLIPVKSAE